MDVKIFDKPEVQDFLKVLSGLNNDGGNARMKEIVHRVMSDLFKAIDDLNVTPDEYWTGIAWLNEIGASGQAGLI
ncbi:MAG: dioxygenase, partial [Shinella sp.]